MDGTETGWGRPAEPAPRWRSLLDRARLGGRTGEQREVDERSDDARAAESERPGRRSAGAGPRAASHNGYSGQSGNGLPAPVSFGHEQTYPARFSYGSEPASGADTDPRGGDPGIGARGYPEPPAGESRYSLLDDGYRPPEPGYAGESRYSLLENGYRPPEPGYAAESRYSLLENGYRPPEPGYAGESRYSLLENGYRPAADGLTAPEAGYAPTPTYPGREPGYPAVEPGYPPSLTPPAPPPAPAAAPIPAVPNPAAPPASSIAGTFASRLRWATNRPDPEVERAISVLRRSLDGPKVLAFANPKGGVHKTTATVLAAATVGSIRGKGVLAWDDNELRGTLGLRAGSARHARTIRHLVADLAMVENLSGEALIDRLDDYLRHASDGSYDVLAGEENARFAQRLDQFTVRRVLELLRSTHEVICVDTGNNVESPNWRTVLHAADQLVITTVPREDAAFTADWMLDLLHEEGMSELANNAVTLLSCPTPGRSPLHDDLVRHFATRTRAVAVVPYDPALETGSSIEYPQLQEETRQSWLKAAAVMLEPFVH